MGHMIGLFCILMIPFSVLVAGDRGFLSQRVEWSIQLIILTEHTFESVAGVSQKLFLHTASVVNY
jgi:hypothetical protein